MNLKEIKKIYENSNLKGYFSYSFEGELIPDCTIIYQIYHKWEVFYFDERGNRNNMKLFYSESELCEYLLNEINNNIAFVKKYYNK